MTHIKGRAFPDDPEDANVLGVFAGVSLRDWFAGQALAWRMAGQASDPIDGRSLPRIARECYRIADAMLAEREKDTQGVTDEDVPQ